MKTFLRILLGGLFFSEILLVFSFFFCHGGFGSGVYCHMPTHDSILSQLTATLQAFFQIFTLFFLVPLILPPILGVTTFLRLRRMYWLYQQEATPGVSYSTFLKRPWNLFLLAFLAMQILFSGVLVYVFTGQGDRLEQHWDDQHKTTIEAEEMQYENDAKELKRRLETLVQKKGIWKIVEQKSYTGNNMNTPSYQSQTFIIQDGQKVEAQYGSTEAEVRFESSILYLTLRDIDRFLKKQFDDFNFISVWEKETESSFRVREKYNRPLSGSKSRSMPEVFSVSFEDEDTNRPYLVFTSMDEKTKVTVDVSPLSDANETGWINEVEGRFSEYDLTNNVLVLNDVVEHFHEKYGRLPMNSAEFTNFVPTLKPRYKHDAEKRNGEGWIYQVLYRSTGDRTYELCIDSSPAAKELQHLAQWEYQYRDPYYCMPRTIR